MAECLCLSLVNHNSQYMYKICYLLNNLYSTVFIGLGGQVYILLFLRLTFLETQACSIGTCKNFWLALVCPVIGHRKEIKKYSLGLLAHSDCTKCMGFFQNCCMPFSFQRFLFPMSVPSQTWTWNTAYCVTLNPNSDIFLFLFSLDQMDDLMMLLNAGVDPGICDAQLRTAVDILKKNKKFRAVDAINKHIAKSMPRSEESQGASWGCLFYPIICFQVFIALRRHKLYHKIGTMPWYYCDSPIQWYRS